MKILFLLRSLDIGGLEVVTAVLANKFASEGHYVSVFAFEKRSGKVFPRFGKDIDIIIAGEYRKTEKNVNLLRTLILKNRIDVVVNQWGLPLIPIKTLFEAKKGLRVKVISVYHNDPLQNGRIQGVEVQIENINNPLMKPLLIMKKMLYRIVTGYAMWYVYQKSDVFEVLSPSFVSHFQQFTCLKDTPKIIVQPNPITIETTGYAYTPHKKRKEIIYVGRVDYTQKRVRRIIEVWAQLENDFPEWELSIVGDGEERVNIEHMVKALGLKRVSFEGFQQPRPYYERASILMLTSEFEGFPLVLAECMSFGVVPVVYGSYSAAYDIIENRKNGFVIPKTYDGFNAALMAERIRNIMNDHNKLNSMALAAIEKSKNYSIEKIYVQWMNVIGVRNVGQAN